jgi:hypothetical protein
VDFSGCRCFEASISRPVCFVDKYLQHEFEPLCSKLVNREKCYGLPRTQSDAADRVSAAPMLAHAQPDLASIDGFVKEYSSHIHGAVFGFLRNAKFRRPNPMAPRRRWTDSAE